MPWSIGFGLGPLRYSTRLGLGRSMRSMKKLGRLAKDAGKKGQGRSSRSASAPSPAPYSSATYSSPATREPTKAELRDRAIMLGVQIARAAPERIGLPVELRDQLEAQGQLGAWSKKRMNGHLRAEGDTKSNLERYVAHLESAARPNPANARRNEVRRASNGGAGQRAPLDQAPQTEVGQGSDPTNSALWARHPRQASGHEQPDRVPAGAAKNASFPPRPSNRTAARVPADTDTAPQRSFGVSGFFVLTLSVCGVIWMFGTAPLVAAAGAVVVLASWVFAWRNSTDGPFAVGFLLLLGLGGGFLALDVWLFSLHPLAGVLGTLPVAFVILVGLMAD
jgi:hypothetical protein